MRRGAGVLLRDSLFLALGVLLRDWGVFGTLRIGGDGSVRLGAYSESDSLLLLRDSLSYFSRASAVTCSILSQPVM